jgi:hypothetical protein
VGQAAPFAISETLSGQSLCNMASGMEIIADMTGSKREDNFAIPQLTGAKVTQEHVFNPTIAA